MISLYILFLFLVIWFKGNKSLRLVIETDTTIKYEAAFKRSSFGYLGFFIQFSFENSVNEITTETNIIPEYFPFPDCTLEGCIGKLV